jgi:hypothetical protein
LTVEADVTYKGNFRIDISAVARIELGSRFKPREVTFVLATILRGLEGHVLSRSPSLKSCSFGTPMRTKDCVSKVISGLFIPG